MPAGHLSRPLTPLLTSSESSSGAKRNEVQWSFVPWPLDFAGAYKAAPTSRNQRGARRYCVEIRPGSPDFQAQWESPFCGLSHGAASSTALLTHKFCYRAKFCNSVGFTFHARQCAKWRPSPPVDEGRDNRRRGSLRLSCPHTPARDLPLIESVRWAITNTL